MVSLYLSFACWYRDGNYKCDMEKNARRLAFRVAPPAILVEYEVLPRGVVKHKEFPLRIKSDECKNQILKNLQGRFSRAGLRLPTHQISRLLDILISRLDGTQTQSTRVSVTDSILNSTHKMAADLNRVSEEELAAAKAEMDVDFERNRLKPGDPGFEYDKQVCRIPRYFVVLDLRRMVLLSWRRCIRWSLEMRSLNVAGMKKIRHHVFLTTAKGANKGEQSLS